FCIMFFFFFFSSRRRHTRSYGDWSSDVCSSDLVSHLNSLGVVVGGGVVLVRKLDVHLIAHRQVMWRQIGSWRRYGDLLLGRAMRSEERRVGKECRFRWSADH